MANSTPLPNPVPALPSTADSAPYVSISWMAVAASTIAGLFLLILIALGMSAFLSKKPLLLDELLILPVVGLVLSFAARRMIRNSEGTRSGEDLANVAWWICLVGGLGYAAYLLGVSFSVRRDAANEADRWVGYVLKGETNRAFIRTREPGRRGNLNPDDTATLLAQFRNDFLSFNQSDLVRLAARNVDGKSEFSSTGVRDWMYQPGVIKCVYTGVVNCAEGKFPVEVELRGVEADAAGRQWSITLPAQGGFLALEKSSRTPYGWLIAELESSGTGFGMEFIQTTRLSKEMRRALYHTEISPEAHPKILQIAGLASFARVWVGLDPAAVIPMTPDYPIAIRDRFLRSPTGDLSSIKREQFLMSWQESGLFLPGERMKGNEQVDRYSTLTVTDSAVEVRVPCEIQLPGVGGDPSAARGRLVVATNDPELLAKLKRLREQANPELTTIPPDGFGKTGHRWRVVGLESDMHEIKATQLGPGAN